MRNRWLNIVLILTNRIYSKKQVILHRTGISIISDVFILIGLEIILAVVSFPLYLSIRKAKTVAYLKEKGGYGEIAADYNMRRVLTLTGVGLFFLIWFIKFVIIIGTPSVYGPLQLYSISDLRPAEISSEELVIAGVQIETSKIISSMLPPKLEEVKKVKGRNYVFSGKGKPLSKVILMLSDRQTVIYSGDVDEEGKWQIEHSQRDFKLSEGNHSVLVFSYDENLGARSNFSTEQFFKVKTSLKDKIISNIDIMSNWLVVILIVVGIFLTILVV
jgi:hypothetical protein